MRTCEVVAMCLKSQWTNSSLGNPSSPSGTNNQVHHVQSHLKQPPAAGLKPDFSMLSSPVSCWSVIGGLVGFGWIEGSSQKRQLIYERLKDLLLNHNIFSSTTTEKHNPATALSMWAVGASCHFARHYHVVSLSRVCQTVLTYTLSHLLWYWVACAGHTQCHTHRMTRKMSHLAGLACQCILARRWKWKKPLLSWCTWSCIPSYTIHTQVCKKKKRPEKKR